MKNQDIYKSYRGGCALLMVDTVHKHIYCNIFYTLYDCNEHEAHERRKAITLTSFCFLIELWVNFRVCFTSALCADEILFIFMSFFSV